MTAQQCIFVNYSQAGSKMPLNITWFPPHFSSQQGSPLAGSYQAGRATLLLNNNFSRYLISSPQSLGYVCICIYVSCTWALGDQHHRVPTVQSHICWSGIWHPRPPLESGRKSAMGPPRTRGFGGETQGVWDFPECPSQAKLLVKTQSSRVESNSTKLGECHNLTNHKGVAGLSSLEKWWENSPLGKRVFTLPANCEVKFK